MRQMPRPDRSADALLRGIAVRLAAAERLTPMPTDPALSALTEATVTVLGARAASIAIHDPSTDRLTFAAAAGPQAGEVIGLSIDATAGIAGYAFTTGQPLAVADVAADPRFDRTVAEATGYVPRSLLATPLVDEAGSVGVLEVLDGQAATFTLHDLDVAAAFARAATRIHRAGALGRDAGELLRSTLTGLLAAEDDPTAAEDVAAVVSRAVATLADDHDDAVWRLADRLARLRDVDPEMAPLAVDWLDALLRHAEARRAERGERHR